MSTAQDLTGQPTHRLAPGQDSYSYEYLPSWRP